jgi:hypothetical protein
LCPTDPINGRDLSGLAVAGVCIQAGLALAGGYGISTCFVADDHGHFGITITIEKLVGLEFGASIGIFLSNANTIYDLTGKSKCGEGSLAVFSGEVCFWGDTWSIYVGVGYGSTSAAYASAETYLVVTGQTSSDFDSYSSSLPGYYDEYLWSWLRAPDWFNLFS